jgi:hypothetical protein
MHPNSSSGGDDSGSALPDLAGPGGPVGFSFWILNVLRNPERWEAGSLLRHPVPSRDEKTAMIGVNVDPFEIETTT